MSDEHPAPWRWRTVGDPVLYDDALIDGNGERVMWASDAVVPHIRRASGRVAMLVAAAPDMEALLREAETSDDGYRCPWCFGERADGKVSHDPNCRLGRVLARIDAALTGEPK